MCTPDKLDKNETFLIEAFSDAEFKIELNKIRLEIEEELKKFIVYLKENLKENQKIFENLESRIKSLDKFIEKIHRKDYIKLWPITSDINENQSIISTHLPDLIGFRINCFFWQDEEPIYNLLKQYYESYSFSNCILNFNENKKQENGHPIQKVSGTYKEKYCFEIQIKSIMHNIWGEVEHKTIYKNQNYDADISSKKSFTEELFNILQASDRQLVTLINKKTDEKQLIYALFYEKTKFNVAQKTGTTILAKHYNGFFQIFSDSSNLQLIKQYIATSLLETTYKKEPISLDFSDEITQKLSELIRIEFLEYNLKSLFYICEILYDISDFDQFILFLSKHLSNLCPFEEDDFSDSEDDDLADAFDDYSDQTLENHMKNLLTLLNDKIGGKKKYD